ncbi:MAG: RagB/SusD family nutrient uptake outer membrane protein, partial [Muribaculaceae bacterium]|nr:RagB/SusD family nutrient uptake outer membrane protein [Muribaculaceae bacterium]
MKAYIFKTAVAAGIIAVAGACADLDYNELTTNDEEWVYDSPIYGVEKLVNDVYAQLTNGFENNWNGALLASATDESAYALINSGIHTFYNGGWSANNPIPDYWKNNYTAIHEANNFLEKLDKIDLSDYIYSTSSETAYETLRARFELFAYEVRALRAWYYFELVRTYGDVPLVLTTLTIDEANNVERTPAAKVFEFIVDECDAIAEFL